MTDTYTPDIVDVLATLAGLEVQAGIRFRRVNDKTGLTATEVAAEQMRAEREKAHLTHAAKMLRAFPDMLAALKEAKEAYELAEAHGWAPAHRPRWAAIIAKAEGRS